jgi:hypothetical protein
VLDAGCSGKVRRQPGLVERRLGSYAVVGPESGESFEVTDGLVVRVGGVTAGDLGERGSQPRLTVLDRRCHWFADGPGEQVVEESGVGPPKRPR